MVISKDSKTLQQEYIKSLIDSYTQKTRQSKEIAQKYRPVLADKSSLGFNFSLELKEICYPVVCDRSFGSKLWDIDGNEYIDMLMGLGINLFGHNPPFVREAIEKQLQQGIQLGAQTKLAGEVAALISEITNTERVTLSNTGTEAIMTAIRVARAETGKSKIAIFTNSYVKTTFFAGTFCKHPLALAAAKAILLEIKHQGNSLYEKLNQSTTKLVSELNNYMVENSIPVKFVTSGSFFAIALSQSKISPTAINLLSYQLLNKGLHLRNGDKGGFLSTAHTDEDIEFIKKAFQDSLKVLQINEFV